MDVILSTAVVCIEQPKSKCGTQPPVTKVALVDAPASASALRFSADGKRLISLSSWGDTISRLDIETEQGIIENLEERQFTSGARYAEAHALTYDKIAIGSTEGKIQLWNTITGEKLSSPQRACRFTRSTVRRAFTPTSTESKTSLGVGIFTRWHAARQRK